MILQTSFDLVIPETLRYWLAGLLEGEGSFRLQKYKAKNGKVYAYPVVAMGMTDEDVVRQAHSITNVGRVDGPRPSRDGVRKPVTTWYVTRAEEALAVMRLVRPLMGERRGQQIDKVLEEWAQSRN